jgi:hypothetical protein
MRRRAWVLSTLMQGIMACNIIQFAPDIRSGLRADRGFHAFID